MTIKECRKKRTELELTVLEAVEQFERETALTVDSIYPVQESLEQSTRKTIVGIQIEVRI